MRRSFPWFCLVFAFVAAPSLPNCLAHWAASGHAASADGNRLTYLDEPCDPYYVHRDFPKLITPQWVGEEGVQAVVVLAIDDMRDSGKYESYLRPILERLKKIDGRAPVSIMTNRIDPNDPQLAKWLQEGLSIEVHTYDHPCPLLQGGDFAKAKNTYDRCVDLLNEIPGGRPVAYRMPCCDSLNTPSPRFWVEIFNQTTKAGNYLQLDSSVFHVFTPDDPALPREVVQNQDGAARFRRYLPFPSFVNTIENYPYPYVIARLCWQFPCVVPSDWEAQHVQRPNNPRTVEDLKRALDATVVKQGVYNLVFHPHGWIRSDQVVDLVDYAAKKYGQKVKFLNFAEAIQRINKNLLGGHPLRGAAGKDNGVRLLDVNNDGFMDVLIGNKKQKLTRIWAPKQRRWQETTFPPRFDLTGDDPSGVRFGVLDQAGGACAMRVLGDKPEAYQFSGGKWGAAPHLLQGLESLLHDSPSRDRSKTNDDSESRSTVFQLRDLNKDGRCELIYSEASTSAVFQWAPKLRRWTKLPFGLPQNTTILDPQGRDAGLRFVDVNQDGHHDVLFSNERGYSLHLFDSPKTGWSIQALSGRRDDADAVPMISRHGTNNGAWFHSDHLWVQNEDTDRLPDKVARMSFDKMLEKHRRRQARLRQPPLPVGAAKVDITPTFPVRLSGYGSRRSEAKEAVHKIWARALAMGSDQDGPLVLLSIENCSVTPQLAADVAAKLQSRTKLPRENLVISCTHTHTAPLISHSIEFLFPDPLPPEHRENVKRYTKELTQRMVEAAVNALANRRPARLAWTVGNVGIAANRRVVINGSWAQFGVQKDGPVDHRLPILTATNLKGNLLAIWANYACHCTTLTGDFNQISGDWAGFAMDDLEKTHPGAAALITIGCGADANPQPRGDLKICRQHGEAFAQEVRRRIKDQSKMRLISHQLRARRQTIELPFDAPLSKQEWRKRAGEKWQTARHAAHFLKKIEQGQPIPKTLAYPLSSWTFGNDLAMVFLGGEVVVDYARRLDQLFDADRLWVTAYANDVSAYIPSRRILQEGGYEADLSQVLYGHPTRFAPEVEDLIIDAVHKLLPHEFYAKDRLDDFPPPKSPAQSLAAIKTRPGMKVELAAAEPLVVDPVAFDWDADGRLWVVEMRDYPFGLDASGKPGGRVKVLTDTDRDGRYDRAVVFLEDIPFPTGVKTWRGGVLITAAPTIFYAEDTSGDGKADVRKPLFEGFGEGNQQHRVNGLRWGLDNWLYVANGDSDGRIKSTKTGRAISIRGRDLRVRPDSGELQPQAGRTQFGRCRDDWGNWFGGNNSNPMWHYVLSDSYLSRNPHWTAPLGRKQVSRQPGAAPVFPISRTLSRFNDFDKANRFTSACSPIIYRDTLLGEDFPGNAFICEPVHNLVHREIMRTEGVSFTSERADDERAAEFFASSDNWCRPVMARTGPDGALWIADMYRFVIEHPKWIPSDRQRKLDLGAGRDKGRIYRVYPEGVSPRSIPRLSEFDTKELIQSLDSPNGWIRDMSQQMLLWRNDPAAPVLLIKHFQSTENPLGRLHALCTLDGLGKLRGDIVTKALQDPHPGVRRHAVRLSEPFLKTPEILERVLQAAADKNQPLRLQAAYSLGQSKDPQAAKALAKVMLSDHNDPYLRAAAFSSLHTENIGAVLQQTLASKTASQKLISQLIGVAALMKKKDAVSEALVELTRSSLPHSQRFTVLAEVLDAARRRGIEPRRLLNDSAIKTMNELLAQARKSAADVKAPLAQRQAAIRLLGRTKEHREQDIAQLGEFLSPQSSPPLQQAAAQGLARLSGQNAAQTLLAGWRSHSPSLRDQILDGLLAKQEFTMSLLDFLEQGKISPASLDARRRQQLLQHRSRPIRDKATRLFALGSSPDRQTLVAQYAPVAARQGDQAKGKAIFAKRCASCHKLHGVGTEVGPDLAALNDKSTTSLLVAMLDPNRAVEDKYRDYLAVTTEGRQFNGMIWNESDTAVTLKTADGKEIPLLRAELEEFASTGKSLMPEGIEKDVPPTDMRDLIAYLQTAKPPPKSFPGNQPQVIHPDSNGELVLSAQTCKIYGPTLVLEQQYHNLGYWQSEEDRAIWTIDIKRPGEYRVALDFACAADSAGGRFTISAGGQTIQGKVPSTGTWDDYRTMPVETLRLDSGIVDVEMKSVGRPKRPLIELRQLRLTPIRSPANNSHR